MITFFPNKWEGKLANPIQIGVYCSIPFGAATTIPKNWPAVSQENPETFHTFSCLFTWGCQHLVKHVAIVWGTTHNKTPRARKIQTLYDRNQNDVHQFGNSSSGASSTLWSSKSRPFEYDTILRTPPTYFPLIITTNNLSPCFVIVNIINH